MSKPKVIRTVQKGSLILTDSWQHKNCDLSIVVSRRAHPESSDNEHWWIRSVELTPTAARRLRDQIDAWLTTTKDRTNGE